MVMSRSSHRNRPLAHEVYQLEQVAGARESRLVWAAVLVLPAVSLTAYRLAA